VKFSFQGRLQQFASFRKSRFSSPIRLLAYTTAMRAYEVFLNGKRLCVAGVGSDGYISAYITYRSEPEATWINVMGLINRKKLYVRWTQRNLRTGDEVLLRVVDRKSVDRYKIIRQHDEKRDLESMKRHVRKMAKSLGMAVLENPKPKKG
jgi:hypothetical protein